MCAPGWIGFPPDRVVLVEGTNSGRRRLTLGLAASVGAPRRETVLADGSERGRRRLLSMVLREQVSRAVVGLWCLLHGMQLVADHPPQGGFELLAEASLHRRRKRIAAHFLAADAQRGAR